MKLAAIPVAVLLMGGAAWALTGPVRLTTATPGPGHSTAATTQSGQHGNSAAAHSCPHPEHPGRGVGRGHGKGGPPSPLPGASHPVTHGACVSQAAHQMAGSHPDDQGDTSETETETADRSETDDGGSAPSSGKAPAAPSHTETTTLRTSSPAPTAAVTTTSSTSTAATTTGAATTSTHSTTTTTPPATTTATTSTQSGSTGTH